jgi:hypothetical protein
MSYTLTLQCGCTVYVACDPETAVAHTRVVERRERACQVRKHEVGVKLQLWDILPARRAESGSEEPVIDWN